MCVAYTWTKLSHTTALHVATSCMARLIKAIQRVVVRVRNVYLPLAKGGPIFHFATEPQRVNETTEKMHVGIVTSSKLRHVVYIGLVAIADLKSLYLVRLLWIF